MSCVVPGCQFPKNSSEKVSMHLFPDPDREPTRHLNWVRAINCDKIFRFDPYVVFKRFRVCRNHFAKDCFNGECKKLLTTAVPTLFLSSSNPDRLRTKYQIYEQKIVNLLKSNAVNVEDDALKLINIDDNQVEAHLLKMPEGELKTISFDEKLWSSNSMASADEENENENEEFVLMEVVNDSQENQSFTIVLPQETPVQAAPKVLNYQKPATRNSHALGRSNTKQQKSALQPLSKTKLRLFKEKFLKSPKNLLAQSICTKTNPLDVLTFDQNASDFTHKIDLKINEKERKEHWCHAAFMIMRLPLAIQFNSEDFEFSQAHFMYWDIIERCYSYLNRVVECSGQNIDDVLMSLALDNPLNEGSGNFNIMFNVISKHGLMPKQCFASTLNGHAAQRLYRILKSKLREYAKTLRDLLSAKRSISEIHAKVDEQMSEIFGIVGILFGTVPEKFNWEFRDSSGKSSSINSTPLEFYEKFVRPHFNIGSKVTLVTDSRPSLEFGKAYVAANCACIDVVGGRRNILNNQPDEILIDLVTKSVAGGDAVLASCSANGLNEFQFQNLKHLCDVKITSSLGKSDRNACRDNNEKQSLIICGAEVDKSGRPSRFQLLSFDEAEGRLISIPKDILSEIIIDITVDKRFISGDILNVFETQPAALEPLDVISSFSM